MSDGTCTIKREEEDNYDMKLRSRTEKEEGKGKHVRVCRKRDCGRQRVGRT